MSLYACGSNGSGQLGLGNEEDQSNFTHVLDIPCPVLAGGGNHTVLVSQGKAYVSGKVGGIESHRFTLLDHPHQGEWLHCSAGWEHLVLADSNSVYTLGKGIRGELGLGESETHYESPQLSLVKQFDSRIAQISCGPTHTIVRLEDKELWGWGYNRQSPLGIDLKIVWTPTKLPFTGDSVACGRDFSIIVSQATAQGWGRRAQITQDNVLQVYAGWSFYGLQGPDTLEWQGNNTFGQTDGPESLEQIAVGSEHGIGVKDNQVLTWGWGEHGNCPDNFVVRGKCRVFGGCATSWVWVEQC